MAQSLDQQDIPVALDPTNSLDYNPYTPYLPGDQIGQMFGTPEYGSLAALNLDPAAWKWQESTDSLADLQNLEMQPNTATKTPQDGEGRLKDMVAALRHRLHKSEENMKIRIIVCM